MRYSHILYRNVLMSDRSFSIYQLIDISPKIGYSIVDAHPIEDHVREARFYYK